MILRPLLLAIAAAVSLPACENDSTKECTAILLAGKQNSAKGDLDAARAELEKAQAACPKDREFYVKRLSDQIAEREKLEAEKKKQAAGSTPFDAFTGWIAKRRDADDKSEGEVQCADAGTPEFGWCESKRQGPKECESCTPLTFETRYWKADTRAFRFRTTFGYRHVCAELGTHRLVRTWTQNDVQRVHCEMTDGPLKDLGALLTPSGRATQVDVFSRAYLRQDDGFQSMLKR